jgi:hypothetical protein
VQRVCSARLPPHMSPQPPRPPLSVPRPRPGASVPPPRDEAAKPVAPAVPSSGSGAGLGTFSGLGAKAKAPDPTRLAPTMPPQRPARAAPNAPAIPKAPAVPTATAFGHRPTSTAAPAAPAAPPATVAQPTLSAVGESTGNESLSFFVANTGAAPAPGALMPSRSADAPATAPSPSPAPVATAPAASVPATKPATPPGPRAAGLAPPAPPTGSRANTASPGGSKPSFRSSTLLGLPTPLREAAPSASPSRPPPAPPGAAATGQAGGGGSVAPRPSAVPGAAPRASRAPAEAARASKAALDAVPTQLGGFEAAPAAASRAPRPPTAPATSTGTAKKPPYVNIHLDRPAPEDLTPTIPRDAVAYIEAHGGSVPGHGASAPPPADDDPEAGWDDPPEIAASPLVPQVPVVLAGSSPALPAPAPLAAPAEVVVGHQPYAADEIEDLSSRHLLAEVDDALPTPAINGLPEGVHDAVPLARAIAEAVRASSLSGDQAASAAPRPSTPPPVPTGPRHIGVVPPPPLPPPSGTASPSPVPSTASAEPPSPNPPPAIAGAAEIPVLPLVSAPANAQKTQKIVRPANAPRLVPEVMTPALLSAGPYRGEVHLEANASGPALPAVQVYDPVAAAPMLRDAQPTVVAQHRLAEAALAARRQVESTRPGPIPTRPAGVPARAVLGAIAAGSFAAVFLLGVGLATGFAPHAPAATAQRASLPVSRAMFEARRTLEEATAPATPPTTPPSPPATGALVPPTEAAVAAAPSDDLPAPGQRRAEPSRAQRRTPTAAKVVARGSADGF